MTLLLWTGRFFPPPILTKRLPGGAGRLRRLRTTIASFSTAKVSLLKVEGREHHVSFYSQSPGLPSHVLLNDTHYLDSLAAFGHSLNDEGSSHFEADLGPAMMPASAVQLVQSV